MKDLELTNIALRLELVALLYNGYGVDYMWCPEMHRQCGGYYDGKYIRLNMTMLVARDSVFWTVVYHELAHFLGHKTNKFKKAYEGSASHKIQYLTMMRNRVEKYTDKIAKQMLSIDYPGIRYMKTTVGAVK